MNYRREIDGLRALAVLPVILFHAGFSLFEGGFVGVDIFFVISGYLITSIILSDLSQNTFSLRRFYARRARRILPALFVVLFVCIPFAFVWMLPSQYRDFSQSLVAVTLFASNMLFWRESGYFEGEALEKPLLHTWSLGVEEQYYVLFPLALLICWRFVRHRTFYLVAAGALISLALCEYASRYYSNANFFLLPTRAWELLVGSLCAFIAMRQPIQRNHFLSLLGCILIVSAIFTFDKQMRLPSVYMFIPVVGTALVLLYGTKDSLAARILSWQPLVSIGLISYSAYLWHYPLFAFVRIRAFDVLSTSTMLLFTIVSLALAAITWYCIEQPFRQKNHKHYVSNKDALIAAIISAIILIAIGIYGHLSQGRINHWKENSAPNQIRAYELVKKAQQAPSFDDNGDCVFNAIYLDNTLEARVRACHRKYGPGIAVIGDSHAINLFFVLKTQQAPFLISLAQGMCRPHTPLATCQYDGFLAFLKEHPQIFSHIIYEQAGFYLLQTPFGKAISRSDFEDLALNAPVPAYAPIPNYIEDVIAYLNKLTPYSKVVWLGPRIEPHIRENAMIQLGCNTEFRLRPNLENVFLKLDNTIRQRLKKTPIHYRSQIELIQLDMAHDFMNCETTYWRDGDHYSTAGEQYFGQRIRLEKLVDRGSHDKR